jgi:MFS family permease
MESLTVKRRLAWSVFGLTAGLFAVSFPMNIVMLHTSDVGGLAFNIVFLAVPVAGILIARRQPDNRIAWIMLAVGLIIGVGAVADPYSTYGLVRHPGSLPAVGVVAAVNGSLWVPAIGITGTYLLLLFPDGRLPSRRWAPVAWVSGITMGLLVASFVLGPGTFEDNQNVANPLGIGAMGPVLSVMLAALPLLPLCMLACALSLVMRFRRSRGIERQQVKWLASGAAVAATSYGLAMFIGRLYTISGTESPPWLDTFGNITVLTFVAIPVAICMAVLRYGLYGIDRLISRTLSYALITGTLLVVYLLLVTTVSRITPSSSSLAVAASTLAVAALFQPLRHRVQAVVDRRFNRARYDAERTADAFSRRLREEVDLDAVSSDLIAAVHDTLEPARIGLWLRPSEESS